MIVRYSQKQDYDQAEKILRRMLELRPISDEIHANLSSIHVLRKEYDAAEVWFRKA